MRHWRVPIFTSESGLPPEGYGVNPAGSGFMEELEAKYNRDWRRLALSKIATAVKKYPKRVAIGTLFVGAGLIKAGTMIFSSSGTCGPIC